MAQKVKEVIDLLEENGWRCVESKVAIESSLKKGQGDRLLFQTS